MNFSIRNLVTLSLALSLPGISIAGPTAVRVAPEAPGLVTPVTVPQESPTAFREGEDLKFAIKWGMVTGGYSSLKVQNIEEIDGKPTYHVVAEAHSTGLVNKMYPVNDRNEAWIEPQSQSTLRYARKISEGKYRVEEQVVLNQQTHRFQQHWYRLDKKRYETREGAIPANVLDVLGSLYHARTLPLEVGKAYTIDVHSEDTVYPLTLKVLRRQTVRVKAGKFDCLVLEPQLRRPGIFVAKGKKLEVFLTADERHMPVLMRSEIFIGHVRAELVSHRTVTPAETYALTKGNTPDVETPEVDQ
jgi:hypothetical protein